LDEDSVVYDLGAGIQALGNIGDMGHQEIVLGGGVSSVDSVVVDVEQDGLDNHLVVLRFIDLGGEIVDNLFSVFFVVEFIIGLDASFLGRYLELLVQLIGHVVDILEFLKSELNLALFFVDALEEFDSSSRELDHVGEVSQSFRVFKRLRFSVLHGLGELVVETIKVSGEGFENLFRFVELIAILVEGSNIFQNTVLLLQDLEVFLEIFKVFSPEVSGHEILGELL